MGEIKQQTLSGVKWTAIERFSIQVATFIIGLIVARILTPDDYGLVGLVGVFFTISNILIDSGFGNALVRKADRTEADYYTAFYSSLSISTVCATLIFFCSPWIASFFKQPILSPMTKWMSIGLVIGQFAMIPSAKMYIELNFKSIAKINFICSVASGLIALIIAYLGGGVWALVWLGLSSTIIRVILSYLYKPYKIILIFSKNSFHQLFGYGSKIAISGLLSSVYNEMTTIVIGKFYSPASLGNYSRGTSMATLPVNIITGIVGKVTFPILAKIQNDDTRLISVYRNYISLIMMAVVFCCLLLAALAKPLILFLLTAKWANAIIFVQIFAFAIVFDPISSLNLNLLQVKGRSDLFLRLEVIKKTIALIILLSAIPFGVIAICISKVIYTQIAIYLNTYYTGKLFGLGYWQQWKDFLPYFGYSAVACVPPLLLSLFCPWPIISLTIGFTSALVIYIIELRICKNAVFMEYVNPILNKLINRFKKQSIPQH